MGKTCIVTTFVVRELPEVIYFLYTQRLLGCSNYMWNKKQASKDSCKRTVQANNAW